MNLDYIAGFFDGEGSVLALTIRRELKIGVLYRFQPRIKIAQKTDGVLDEIQAYLNYGFVLHKPDRNAYVIGNLVGVNQFVDSMASRCVVKSQALTLLGQLVTYQITHTRNVPYTRDQLIDMIDLRDEIHRLNTLTRSNIVQKYPRAKILAEHSFVNIREWQLKRAEHGAAALEEAGKPYRFKKGGNRA